MVTLTLLYCINDVRWSDCALKDADHRGEMSFEGRTRYAAIMHFIWDAAAQRNTMIGR